MSAPPPSSTPPSANFCIFGFGQEMSNWPHMSMISFGFWPPWKIVCVSSPTPPASAPTAVFAPPPPDGAADAAAALAARNLFSVWTSTNPFGFCLFPVSHLVYFFPLFFCPVTSPSVLLFRLPFICCQCLDPVLPTTPRRPSTCRGLSRRPGCPLSFLSPCYHFHFKMSSATTAETPSSKD